jgi:hypothetical protein
MGCMAPSGASRRNQGADGTVRYNGVDFNDGDFVIVIRSDTTLEDRATVLINMVYEMLVNNDRCCKKSWEDTHGNVIGFSDIL